jgi:subtilisin
MSAQIGQELRAAGIARVIVVLKDSAKAACRAKGRIARYFATARSRQGGAPARYYPNLGVVLATVDRHGLAGLRCEKSIVEKVTGAPQLSLIRPVRVAAARPPAGTTWGVEAIGAPRLWDEGYTGKGVVVGHLDTGADGSHPALKRAIVAFAEFDRLGRLVKPAPKAYDTDEHGTHTAATIAGRPVDGRRIGVAPGAGLASAIVIEGGEVVARVLGGMDWVIGKGARVLSMSLGLRGWWDDFVTITDRLRAQGVLPVFAVGNEGPGTSRSPGNYWQAVSVGAADRKGAVADFSSSQTFRRKQDPLVPDLVAPGVDVTSAAPGRGYQSMDGTSMATPHIAGLAALLWQARPDARVDEIESAIFASCKLGPRMDRARGNRGMPDAARALEALRSGSRSKGK